MLSRNPLWLSELVFQPLKAIQSPWMPAVIWPDAISAEVSDRLVSNVTIAEASPLRSTVTDTLNWTSRWLPVAMRVFPAPMVIQSDSSRWKMPLASNDSETPLPPLSAPMTIAGITYSNDPAVKYSKSMLACAVLDSVMSLRIDATAPRRDWILNDGAGYPVVSSTLIDELAADSIAQSVRSDPS